MRKAGVIVVPGSAFGDLAKATCIALVQDKECIEEAARHRRLPVSRIRLSDRLL